MKSYNHSTEGEVGITMIRIPFALFESDDYNALNDEQKRSFANRLQYSYEIASKGTIAEKLDGRDLLHIIDDIELDAMSVMSLSANIETTVSPYQVHSSWTFECDRRAMAGYIAMDAANFLMSPCLDIGASYEDIKCWLRKWVEALNLTLEHFSLSKSFTEAVTHLIVADALISSYLVFAATIRLNGQVWWIPPT